MNRESRPTYNMNGWLFCWKNNMNDSNTQFLKETFPTFYKDNFFFECGDGWTDLLFKLGAFVTNRTKNCMAVQIKEKFGLLRIYIDFDVNGLGECLVEPDIQDEIYNYIHELEIQSRDICEDCGTILNESNRVAKRNAYWLANICQNCSQIIKQQSRK